ncbi:MAG: hypothetical protein NTY32_02530 [Bacteroidia bacterium]|nr:hypothetical protein [Bacteroidia bacterium]
MYNRLIHITHRPRAKANHLLRAKRANGGGIHSPYLFRFVTMVLNTKCTFYAFEALEAGHLKEKERSILRLKKQEPHSVERMIFRIVQDQQPSTMLEIGYRTGAETQYMKNACPNATCMSITHAPNLKDDPSLKVALSQLEKLDFVLFNAPAEREQRLNEFRSCLQKAHEGSLFVVKHIHQTPEQALNWRLMRNQPEVRASLDLYSIGILFLKSDLPKCNLRIKIN